VSGIFKSIGKIFKSIVKTVIKIAPYALAAAAVVFTGGAALGLLPTFAAAVGGVVSSLGLSAAVTGALTGAVTSAGFGAALGFVTGGTRGMQKGALMGLLTGGVMGAVNPAMFGVVKGADGLVTTTNALAHGGDAFGAAGKGAFSVVKGADGLYSSVPKGIAPVSPSLTAPPAARLNGPDLSTVAKGLPDLPTAPMSDNIQGISDYLGQSAADGSQAAVTQAGQGIAPLAATQPIPAAAPAATDATSFMNPTTSAAKAADAIQTIQGSTGGVGGIPASGGNILDLLGKNPGLIGSVLQGLGGNSQNKSISKQYAEEYKLREKLAQMAYGGVYAGKTDPFGIGNTSYAIPQPRYVYDAASKTVIDRQQPQGG
jgi:hypothetical protein